jgi:tetratricopeptide (TPR) repeat protein
MAMDGRWKLALVGGLVSGLVGCSVFHKTSPEIVINQPAASAPGGNSVYIPEPPDEVVAKDGPLAPATLIVFGNTWVEAVATDPNKPAAERDKLLNKAQIAFHDALRRDPKSLEALFGLGEMYQVTGELGKLREIEQQIKTQHPNDPKAWAWVAVHEARMKNFDAAAECFQAAARLDPENRQYRVHLGLTLARARRYDEGYEWLKRSMRQAEARYALAKMMIHNGDTEKAREYLHAAMLADPSFLAAKDELMALTASSSDVHSAGFEEPASR